MKKVLEGIKSFFSFVLFVIYFLFALVMTVLLLNYNDYGVTQFGSKSLVIINDEVSNETYKKGDLVIVENLKIEEYKVGDYVFAYKVGADRIPTIQVGKVGTVYPDEHSIAFENGETYSEEYIAGVAVDQHEKIGSLLSVIESKWGFLFIVLIPVFLIFIYEVYSLIIEIKYGTEED